MVNNNNNGKKAPCAIHTNPVGKVYRTRLVLEMVERERICDKCGKHFWTVEESRTLMGQREIKRRKELIKLKSERDSYQAMLDMTGKAIVNYEKAIKMLKEEIGT